MEKETNLPVTFHITDKCSAGCNSCIFDCGPHRKDAKHLNTDVLLAALPHFNKRSKVFVTGGEPTEHPDFFKIIDGVAKQFKKVTLTTNGSWIKNEKAAEEFISKIPKNVSIRMSVDTPHALKISDLKEKVQVFKKVCKKLKRDYFFKMGIVKDEHEFINVPHFGLTGEEVSMIHWISNTASRYYPSKKQVFISSSGKVFPSEGDYRLFLNAEKEGVSSVGKPVGDIHKEGMNEILKRMNY